MLQLFPDEQIVSESSDGSVTLTTHRICYEYKDFGRSYNQNIMLEHITSCENYANSQIFFLVLGGIAVVAGLIGAANDNPDILAPVLLAALIFGILYRLTKRSYIIIASPSTKMQIKVTGMKREKVLDFINTVEQTKHKRLISLSTPLKPAFN